MLKVDWLDNDWPFSKKNLNNPVIKCKFLPNGLRINTSQPNQDLIMKDPMTALKKAGDKSTSIMRIMIAMYRGMSVKVKACTTVTQSLQWRGNGSRLAETQFQPKFQLKNCQIHINR